MTLRSNDQFNTTVSDMMTAFGIKNTRKVVLMNRSDIDRRGPRVGQLVSLKTVAHDGVDRRLPGMIVVAYDLPIGCFGGYYPECNLLMPIWHYVVGSKTPAAKSIPVTIHSDGPEIGAPGMEYAGGSERSPAFRRAMRRGRFARGQSSWCRASMRLALRRPGCVTSRGGQRDLL